MYMIRGKIGGEMINVYDKGETAHLVTTLVDIRISVFVGHKHVAVLQMVLWGSDPSTQEPPISVEDHSYWADGCADKIASTDTS